MVDAICGQANSGMAGWMYVVNGGIPMCGPEKYLIKAGDKVIWYYSKSMDQQPPVWEELVGQQPGGNRESGGGPEAPVPPPVLPAPETGGKAETFADVAGHWAQKEIEFLATKEYLAGVGSNRFAPDAVITRAEFGTVVARLAKLSGQPDGADRFADVPAGAWYRGMVGAAARAGLVRGVSEKRFAPNVPVTREQMAVMIARFMAQKGLDTAVGEAEAAAVLAGFSDAADISSWARHAVTLVVRQGIMQGRAAAQFAPSGRATRAEAAVVLYRVWQQMLPAAR
jgi:hypothetical protein